MSRSWQLTNSDGTTDMRKGDMDITFFNGSVRETASPSETLNQRIRKASIEPQGSNRFALYWGSVFQRLLGGKNLPDDVMRLLSRSLIQLVSTLIAMQSEVQRRVSLEPAELIDSLSAIRIESQGMVVIPYVKILTQAKSADDIVLPEVALGL
jgi:hypothetical protein